MTVVHVTGDLTIDWMSLRGEEPIPNGNFYYWLPGHGDWHLNARLGCAGLVEDLVTQMLSGTRARVRGPLYLYKRGLLPETATAVLNSCLRQPMDHSIATSWTVWAKYRDNPRNKAAVRIHEWRERETDTKEYRPFRLSGKAALLVLVDGGEGFRAEEEAWPESLTSHSGDLKHVILKYSEFTGYKKPKGHDETQLQVPARRSVRPDHLLQKLNEEHLGSSTTIVTSLDHLRACEVRVCPSLSWERLFEDVVRAVRNARSVDGPDAGTPLFVDAEGQLRVFQVVVTVGAAGAIIVRRDNSILIFDETGQEGDFERRYSGGMMGGNTCVVATLAAEWVRKHGNPDWNQAVRFGLGLSRFLLHVGYTCTIQDDGHQLVDFPAAKLAEEYLRKSGHDSSLWNARRSTTSKSAEWDDRIWALAEFAPKDESVLEHRAWSILEETAHDVLKTAHEVAVKGPKTALKGVPIEQIGGWLSADRGEIEGVRSVNNALRDYIKDSSPRTPLCIGVFGPPGAGKSFAIKAIARDLNIQEDAELEFNLSQFASPDELPAAFNQIRDLHLRGKKPLVFWDEFDTKLGDMELGWLRYFLAPMQDGQFYERGRFHPLGGGIHVFAGATTHSYRQFVADLGSANARTVKKPDFVSRLRAYIDVLGPNPAFSPLEDKMFIIRRAVLLNTYLKRPPLHLEHDGQVQLQPGVLNAFLHVPEYTHGARSMETLVRMSPLRDKRVFELSSLPPGSIVDMHASGPHFNFLARETGPAVQIGLLVDRNVEIDIIPTIYQKIRTTLNAYCDGRPLLLLTEGHGLVNRSLADAVLTRRHEVRGRLMLLESRSPASGGEAHLDPCNGCDKDDRKHCQQQNESFVVPKALYQIVSVVSQGDPTKCAQARGRVVAENAEALFAVTRNPTIVNDPTLDRALKMARRNKVSCYHVDPVTATISEMH